MMFRGVTAVVLASAMVQAASISIVNGTMGWVLKGVFIRPSSAGSEWGENLLGQDGFIGISGTWNHELHPGVYDIRVEDMDGDGYQKFSVTVAESFRWKVSLRDMNDPLNRVNPVYTWGG